MIDIHNLIRIQSNKNKNFDAIASLDTAHAKYIHGRYYIGIHDDMLLDVGLAYIAWHAWHSCSVQEAIVVAFLNISSAPL